MDYNLRAKLQLNPNFVGGISFTPYVVIISTLLRKCRIKQSDFLLYSIEEGTEGMEMFITFPLHLIEIL